MLHCFDVEGLAGRCMCVKIKPRPRCPERGDKRGGSDVDVRLKITVRIENKKDNDVYYYVCASNVFGLVSDVASFLANEYPDAHCH